MKEKSDKKTYDIIIIGGGPAGLTSAIYSARKQLKTLLLTIDIGGQVSWTSDIENYTGYQLVTGSELTKKFEEQVKQFPIDVKEEIEVTSIKKSGDIFIVSDKLSEFSGKAVIIATGKHSRPLNVPGEKELVGRGVTYCSICDAPLFKNKDVAVIGGGNSGFTAVADLINIAKKIYVINDLDKWQADPVLLERANKSDKFIPKLGYKVTEIIGKDGVEGIGIESIKKKTKETLNVNGIFIEIGLVPNSEFVKGFLRLNKWGEIEIDDYCKASVDGIFAAGDVTTVPEKQIIIAAGEGAKAALSAYRYLLSSNKPK